MSLSLQNVAKSFDASSIGLLVFTLVVFLIPVFILFPPLPVEHRDVLTQTHRKLGLEPSQSNLKTQRSADLHQPQPGKLAKIQSLHIYPIKSCRGIELKESIVLAKGMELDRMYCFAQLKPAHSPIPGITDLQETHRWELATLRQLPLLANVVVDLWLPDPTKKSRLLGEIQGGFLVVRFPWRHAGLLGIIQTVAAKLSRGWSAVSEKEFMLPLEFPTHQEIQDNGYKYEDLKFFKETANALNMSVQLPKELEHYLGARYTVGLFRTDPSRRRKAYSCAPSKEQVGYEAVIDFQDEYPIHMASLTSLHALESNIQKDKSLSHLDVRRFRPNIIVSGLSQYDEDDWRSVRFIQNNAERTESKFDVACRAVRCKLPNVDPMTGIRHKLEPDRSLRKYREIDKGAPKKGCFGMMLCPLFAETDVDKAQLKLRVGMEVDVLQRGSHFYTE